MSGQSKNESSAGAPVDSDSEVAPAAAHHREQRSNYVFPWLVKQNALTLVSVDSRVNSEPLAMVLGVRASKPTVLPLFGASADLPCVVCHGVDSEDEQADADALWEALLTAETAESGNAEAGGHDKLQKRYQSESEWSEQLLDTSSGREQFLAQMPSSALIVIHNLRNWMSSGATHKSYAEVAAQFEEWCQHGHTMLVFEATTDEEAPSLQSALPDDVEVLHAAWDPGAPHEFGGGCIITRKRKSYFDAGPRRFNFWFKVFRGELEWGMEIRPDADPLGGKQLEIYQRQMLVDSLLKDGKQQKEIAVRLGWNAATISRDVDALKKKSGLA